MVRLLCAFILSHIRNKKISIAKIQRAGLASTVETFCVDFLKIKEPGQLYRMLKNNGSKDNN